jgi:hypothetical protein
MNSRWLCALLSLVALPMAVTLARADFIEYGFWMTMSDRLPPNAAYGAFGVMTDNGKPGYHVPSAVMPGQVILSFLPLDREAAFDFHGVKGNWGIDALAFNTNLNLSPAHIALPPGCALSQDRTMNGFGTFSWVARVTDPKYRVGNNNWINVVISGLGDQADLGRFTFASHVDPRSPTPQFPAFFAAHVSGGTPTAADGFITEQTIAGDIVGAPEPAALTLCGVGLAAVCAGRALIRAGREKSRKGGG